MKASLSVNFERFTLEGLSYNPGNVKLWESPGTARGLPWINYCNDPKSWEKWDELVQKYPDDLDVQALHALRIGLCAKVERGDLTVKQATEIFERAREAIVERKRVQPNERKGGI